MPSVTFSPDELRPLVREIVAELVAQFDRDKATIDNGKLAYSEAEAAALLSLRVHQLRDSRRRREISASVGPGRKILYSRADLLEYLSRRRIEGNGSE